MLLLGILLFGLVIGAGAQIILARGSTNIDWATALIAGLGGSLVGGLLISLIAGDGIRFRPSGVIGSIVGALIVTAAMSAFRSRQR
ncbi:GlsB/YeaQ/YmgE family stress response membrane protein [Desertimonas flava]|uniref:GlsB/YeaQ/YmgE family stress response membrane protein n=1 Tax=Desertimonas flava TaxID=2064846 RepID=UPI000E345322|nr:GlsB/YeaQ/YmgE family stress response membrane protein [Desertimonas flava]